MVSAFLNPMPFREQSYAPQTVSGARECSALKSKTGFQTQSSKNVLPVPLPSSTERKWMILWVWRVG